MSIFRWVIAILFLFAMVIFGVENMGPVQVEYYFGTVKIPMFLLMAILIFIGAFVTALVGILEQLRLHSRIRKQAKTIKELEVELSTLRDREGRGTTGTKRENQD